MHYTKYAYRRLKLFIAEMLVLGLAERGHSIGYATDVCVIAKSIRAFRETYYPQKPR